MLSPRRKTILPKPLQHSLILGPTLFGIWLLWSGHYTALLISFGIASCAAVVLISWRMENLDEEGQLLLLVPRLVIYTPWLMKEIALANIDVARRILHPRLPISPALIRVKCSQELDLARVIYANSITLTPGTVSVDMDDDTITVHALSRTAAEGVLSGEMDRKVSRTIEGRR